MAEIVSSWDRPFRVWQYTVSHSTLLFRSVGQQLAPTRVDVAFFGVRAMQIRDEYSELVITKAAQLLVDGVLEVRVIDGEPLSRYVLNGGPDYVLATNMDWHSDDGNHRKPSYFGPFHGTL